MQVQFTRSFVPIAAFVVAKAANQDVDFVVVNNNIDTRAVLNHPEGPIRGNFVIASHFAQSDEAASKVFLGANTKYKVEIQQWIEFAAGELSPKEELEVAISRLNSHLQFRTFLAGYKLSLADLAVFEALKAHPKFMGMRNKHTNQLVHVIRWFTYVEQLPEVDQAVKMLFAVIKKGGSTKALQQLNDGAKAVQKAGEDQSNQASMELDLPGAKMGDFCTRFPPEASGFLHIGHAKAAIINDYFARRYKGKLIFRFDDTNPTKEKSEYEESIKQDLVTLNITPDVSTYTSDYFELMLEYATRMIKEEKFYCDKTPTEELRAERLAGVESKYRTQPVEENLRLWKEMQNGTPEGLSCCLRARINMQADNKCLRDPIMYRCNTNPHPHTGDKYKVYPTYDFACPVVDSVEGVTHAFRTNEYHDRNDQYYWVCDALGIRKPHLEDFSRLNMMYSLMSKRKLTHFVDTGLVTGWDDPRFPTVRGLLRRGLRVEALRQFVLQQGVSKNINWMEWEKLWNFNKRIIDPIAPRYTALLPEKIVPLHIVDGPSEPKSESLAKHKKNAELGNKTTIFYNKIFIDQVDAALIKDNEEITLMDWGNCVITKIEKNQAGEVVRMEGKLNLQGSVKTTKWKLTWLADTPDLVPVQLIDYGHLITKVKLEETDDLEKFINRNSKKTTQGLGDLNLRKLKKGETIQLERRGYYIVDQELDDAHNTPLVLICIPDGRKEKN